ncbi:exopolyphosphatase [Motiliproteus sediminis]|uniref:exopolyphosphatase n=1 Tax=Motiliproteus sediminis TaxID=1468178 RepID=UPI001AEFE978|nr:exopolyphosphatase [Motiliproteus sediminis]
MSDAPAAPHYAAIDLGSNSFHLIIAREVHGELQPLDRIGEKVQLAAGLDAKQRLSEEAMERGFACLERFAQRLAGMPPHQIRVVGTNTLRAARNRGAFIERAEELLGVPIEVISGREEARLIYLGVAHALADDVERRLVLDIGGGSTELIIGERFSPLELESLHMGCVSYTRRYFDNGKITSKQFQKAVNAAQLELLNIRRLYRSIGWSDVVGASGTIKAALRLACDNNSTDGKVTLKKLYQIRDRLLDFDCPDDIRFTEIKSERAEVLPGGIAILIALFESLDIDSLRYSDGALREGLLYDMSGRQHHEDVRERTISALMTRYHVDQDQAACVEHSACQMARQAELDTPENLELLRYAARLHESGLAISHSQFQKHGAYLLQHTDMMGFSRSEQDQLALLVLAHRRKLPLAALEALRPKARQRLLRLALLLRLAVLINRSRSADQAPSLAVALNDTTLALRFPENWLEQHPLTQADLEQESAYLKPVELQLDYQ